MSGKITCSKCDGLGCIKKPKTCLQCSDRDPYSNKYKPCYMCQLSSNNSDAQFEKCEKCNGRGFESIPVKPAPLVELIPNYSSRYRKVEDNKKPYYTPFDGNPKPLY